MTLRDEIRQGRPFRSLEEEALLNIHRTATRLEYAFAEWLKTFDLTPTQYNVLRILRGAGESGLCRYEIGDRLIAPVPDVTRLLDRMEDAGLIERERDPDDRRQVRTTLTRKGRRAVDELDGPMGEMHRKHLGHLSKAELRTLVELLESARAKAR